MSFGPLPSQLCLLAALPSKAAGEKVRFLGCVNSYSVTSGTLKMEHRSPPDANVAALVDVSLILEKLGAEQTRTGEWVNVIGYITAAPKSSGGRNPSSEHSEVHVQALLLWSAGPLDIQQYRVSVEHPVMAR
ncbi:CST complex subunit Ten1 [Coniochaeta sp. 2T2.1]|nr:CST complex subunit Ten1 [Coniochaeta sp. 2T2.1]